MGSLTSWLSDIEEEYGSIENYYNSTRRNSIHYVHVIENSHFWTNLTQLQEWLKYTGKLTKEELVEYLKIGIENTINNGFNLKKND